MKLLITGGAGYIGSVVAELAVADGHSVVVLDDLRAGNRAAIPGRCKFIEGSLGDPQALAAAFDAGPHDAVLHLAAEAAIEPSIVNPGLYFQVNFCDTLLLLETMRAHGVGRLVFSSTAAVYGEPLSAPIPESHPKNPINAYGESKLMCERSFDWFHRAYGLETISFRYFNAAGASAERGEARAEETHLLPLVLDAAAGRRPRIEVFGTDYDTVDGTCVRDYVHVSDIARAHLLALARIDGIGSGAFNLGSGTGYSVRQIIDAVERATGRPVPWREAGRRAGDPAVLVADASRARETLGWVPTETTLSRIVESAWAWRLSHPEGYRPV